MGAYEALAASYDRLTNDVNYGAIVAFYEEILKKEGLKPRTAVDLACGTGSVSAILAGKGLSVIGVDMSEEMLTAAQQKCADLQNPPRFVRQSLQRLCLPRGVDLAVCALDSLDYITKPGGLQRGHPACLEGAEPRRDIHFRREHPGKAPRHGRAGVSGRGR